MKKITSLMLALIMILSFAVTASAANTGAKNGLSVAISTNADAYFEEEAVKVTITVKNNSGKAIKDITAETLLPEGLYASKGQSTNAKFSLAAGETKTIRLEVYADRAPDLPSCDKGDKGPHKGDKGPDKGDKKPDKNANDYNDLEGDGCLPTEECKKHNDCAGDDCLPTDECNKDKDCNKKEDTCKGDGTCPDDCYCKQPCTGDSFNAFLWVAVLMFAVAAGVLVLKGNKKAIKTMCLMFCVLMALAVIPVGASAANDVIVVDTTVQIGYYEYIIKAKVSFNGGSSNGVGSAPETTAPATEWEDDVTFVPDLGEGDFIEEDVATTAPVVVETTASPLDAGLDAIAGAISDMTEDGTVDKLIALFK